MPRIHRYSLLTAAVSGLIPIGVLGCGNGVSLTPCPSCKIPPPQAITMTVKIPATPLVKLQGGTITVNVSAAAAQGNVEITTGPSSNPSNFFGSLSGGTAPVTVVPPIAGEQVYDVSYPGDGIYGSAEQLVEVPVMVAPSASSCGLGSATYVVSSGSVSPAQTSFGSADADESAVCAQNAGTVLTLVSPQIAKSGTVGYGYDPSGIDAAVLAYGSSAETNSGATVNLQGSPSITVSQGNYAVFASGEGAAVNMSGAAIDSTGTTAAAIGAGNNGALSITGSTIATAGTMVDILNGGSVTLESTTISAAAPAPGQPAYPGMYFAGPVGGGSATIQFRMTGGALTNSGGGPDIEFANTQQASVYFSQVNLDVADSVAKNAVLASLMDSGTTLTLTLDQQAMRGSIEVGPDSTLTLENSSSLDGDFQGSAVTMDAGSLWTIYSDTTLQSFQDPGGISGSQVLNVTGNGHNIHYSPASSPQLAGMTYSLQGGGSLEPSE